MLTGMSVYGIELSLTFPTLLAKYQRFPDLTQRIRQAQVGSYKISLNHHDPTRQFAQNFLLARFLSLFRQVTSW